MLSIRDLRKNYGKFVAVNGINIDIPTGEVFGFVGPNGAGKTTTMKIIAGLLRADSGYVFLDETEVIHNPKRIKEKIGYMPDFFGVYDNFKAIEYMEFYASIHNINGQEARRLCLELLDLVNLSDKADSYVDGLSRGMKQRLCLARCLIHNPSLLLLDEPASGLDPRARHEMKEILKNLQAMGKTIMISSHILPELAQMCSSIGVMERGNILLYERIEQLNEKIRASRPVIITFMDQIEEGIRLLKEHPQAGRFEVRGRDLHLSFKGTQDQEAELLRMLITNGIRILQFKREEGDLETVFMEITEQRGGNQDANQPGV